MFAHVAGRGQCRRADRSRKLTRIGECEIFEDDFNILTGNKGQGSGFDEQGLIVAE